MADLLDLLDEVTAERHPCGHRAGRGLAQGWNVASADEHDHAVRCLNLTCPQCRISTPNAYQLIHNHGIRFDGLCSALGWAVDRVAHCLACSWPTFGEWPCRNQACPQHECREECTRMAGNPHYLDTHPWGKDAELGRAGIGRWRR